MFERIKEEVRAGRSIPAAISAGYAKALRTIIDANVVTIGVAFILFTLATAGVHGLRVHAGSRHPGLAVHGRARHLGDPRLDGAHAAAAPAERARRAHGRRPPGLALRLHGQLALVLLVLGRDPPGRRARDRRPRDQLRHRLRVRHADHGAAAEGRRASTRCATRSRRSATRDAQIQEVKDPELGKHVFQIAVKQLGPAKVQKVRERARRRLRRRQGRLLGRLGRADVRRSRSPERR